MQVCVCNLYAFSNYYVLLYTLYNFIYLYNKLYYYCQGYNNYKNNKCYYYYY